MNLKTPDIIGTLGRKQQSFASVVTGNTAGSFATAAGLTSGKNSSPFAQELNQQFSLKTSAAQTQATDAASQHDKAEKAAEGLVSNALILPILKQLRRSTEEQKGVFSGGNGEKTFGPQFDMQLADRIAQSPRLGIKKALADRMMKKGPQAALKKTGLDVHG